MSIACSRLLLKSVLPALVLAAVGLHLSSDTGAADSRQIIRSSPGRGALPTVEFAVEDGSLVPGATGEVWIHTVKAVPLTRGRLVLELQPPVFPDSPSLRFAGGAPEGSSFSLTSLSRGVYVIEFSSSVPLDLQKGPLLALSGTVDADLPVGTEVLVDLNVETAVAGGATLRASGRGGRMKVVPQEETLVLHVDGAEDLLPGTTADVGIRTYNPKPISQGQVDLRYDWKVFRAVNSVTVTGAEPDVSFATDLGTPGVVRVAFTSTSASINRLDGPMVTIQFSLAMDLTPDGETVVALDTASSFLLDELQRPIPISARNGVFKFAD